MQSRHIPCFLTTRLQLKCLNHRNKLIQFFLLSSVYPPSIFEIDNKYTLNINLKQAKINNLSFLFKNNNLLCILVNKKIPFILTRRV